MKTAAAEVYESVRKNISATERANEYVFEIFNTEQFLRENASVISEAVRHSIFENLACLYDRLSEIPGGWDVYEKYKAKLKEE